MDLRAYLTRHNTSISAFAEAIDVTAMAVYRYLSGERIPRPEVMERIVAATGGEVRPNDFYPAGRGETGLSAVEAA